MEHESSVEILVDQRSVDTMEHEHSMETTAHEQSVEILVDQRSVDTMEHERRVKTMVDHRIVDTTEHERSVETTKNERSVETTEKKSKKKCGECGTLFSTTCALNSHDHKQICKKTKTYSIIKRGSDMYKKYYKCSLGIGSRKKLIRLDLNTRASKI